MNLTAVVLAKNEEKNIERCLKSLYFAGEILVIDDFSTDKTVEIARRFGAKVYNRLLNGDFASQRNFAMLRAKYDWVFFVDADEVVPEKTKLEIISKVGNPLAGEVGYFVKRDNYFLGKRLDYGEASSISLLRLGNRKYGKWKRKVHEYWDIRGKVGMLNNKIDHYFCDNLFDFIERINWYSELHAKANQEEGKKSSLFKILFYPPFKFLDAFVLKKGFLDGVYGFVFAFLMSFHSFLSWSKLWLLQRGKKLVNY